MNTAIDTMRRIIEGETPTPAEAADMARLWPACILPDVRIVEADPDSADAPEQRRRIASAVGEYAVLERLLGAGAHLDGFYPEGRNSAPSTEDTIDAFLGKFSRNNSAVEARMAEAAVFNPAPADYLASLGQPAAPEAPASTHEAAPARTVLRTKSETLELSQEKTPEPPSEKTPPAPPHDAALSESLARVMIKNHNYQKAYEIINAIRLADSEKSIYFADQLRFLRKLIINDNNNR